MQPGKAKRLRPAARLETGKGGQTLKKALVTGICGFIGSHLACALASHGMQVTGVDVRCESLNPELMKLIENGTVTVHKGDLLGFDFSSLGCFDYVYQVAGKVSAWGDLADFDRVNVDGTRRVIDCAKAAGSRVFVYLSSVAVYGYRGYRDLPEEGEKKPMDNPYSLSKLHAETMVAEHCREIGLHYLVIRPGNVYGEYDMTSSYDLYRLVSKGKMAVVDRGRHLSCFVYAGNRLHDSIAIFAVGPEGDLSYLGEEWTRGNYPRSFNFDPTGRFLYCCNQRADNIAVFRIDSKNGGLNFTGHYAAVGNPSIIVFLDLAKVP